MILRLNVLAVVLATILLVVPNASADLVLSYASVASTSNSSLIPATTADGLSATSLSQGGGLTANAGSTWNWRGWDTASTSFEDAFASDDYWTWGFTVNASGVGGNVSSVVLDTLSMRVDRSGTGPDDIEVRASVNGGIAQSIFTHDYIDSASGVDFIGNDISSLGPLAVGDTITFLFAGFNSESSAGTMDLENLASGNGIEVNGTVNFSNVPEPTTFVMFGSVFLGGLGFRRRK